MASLAPLQHAHLSKCQWIALELKYEEEPLPLPSAVETNIGYGPCKYLMVAKYSHREQLILEKKINRITNLDC